MLKKLHLSFNVGKESGGKQPRFLVLLRSRERPETTRMGVILGKLAAAQAYGFPREALLLSFIHIFVDLKALEYPSALIAEACMKKFHYTKDVIWKLLATLTKFMK